MSQKKSNFILAGAIGNALEWYDFTIYAFFVPIIAKQFFPNKDPLTSLLITFGVFAIGFLVRPIGAVLFGYIGDHAGRKKALVISMAMMSLPTFLIGLLPTYIHMGLLAPLLLIVLRIIQGLAVSGELTTATVFLIEHAPHHQRGFAGSLAMSGAFGGMVISSLFASIISTCFSEAHLYSIGWRIPFLIGGLIGIVGLVIRLQASDPTLYTDQVDKVPPKSVTKHMASLNYAIVARGIALTSIMAIANYFLIAYFNTFLVETQGLPLKAVMLMNTIALAIQMVFVLGMGKLSDIFGRKPVLSAGILGLAILGLPIFWLLTQHNLAMAFLGEILFAIPTGTIAGLIPTTLTEMFDTYHRNTGVSLSYNIALALFGGTTPLVALMLVTSTHSFYAPAYYLITCAVFALIILLTSKAQRFLPDI